MGGVMSERALTNEQASELLKSRSWAAPDSVRALGNRSLLVGGVGLALLAVGFFVNRAQFFQAYLTAWIYILLLGLGCLGILMLHHMTRGAWGLVVRRQLEAGARTLPTIGLLFLPILFGMNELYSWMRPEMAAKEVVHHKIGYLNQPFFIARYVLYFLIWSFLAWQLSRLSRQQDQNADPALTRRMQVYAAPGLLIFALSVSFASFDWMMSLDPEWWSTIYGIYFIGCAGLAGFAFLNVSALWLSRQAPLNEVLAPRHFHDYGKLMLAFTMLWAYFSFSQFLIIWSGNLPEEITFYLHRNTPGWQFLTLVLPVLHFALPFVLLLSRNLKRDAPRLAKVAAFILVMRFVDLYWQIAPNFNRDSMMPHWQYFAGIVGLGGVWLGLFARELASRPILPVNAPDIEEAIGDA